MWGNWKINNAKYIYLQIEILQKLKLHKEKN